MLKTVKNGSGIREDPPPPCFFSFKIPTFSRFFFGNVPNDADNFSMVGDAKMTLIMGSPNHFPIAHK